MHASYDNWRMSCLGSRPHLELACLRSFGVLILQAKISSSMLRRSQRGLRHPNCFKQTRGRAFCLKILRVALALRKTWMANARGRRHCLNGDFATSAAMENEFLASTNVAGRTHSLPMPSADRIVVAEMPSTEESSSMRSTT